MKDTKPRAKQERAKVLVCLHGDGYVETFAEQGTDVFVVNVPYAGDSAEAQRLAEQYVTLTIPRTYRQLLAPGMIRAAENHRLVLPSDIQQTQHELATLAAIRDMGSMEGVADVA